jgi:hypothetical protein
VQRDELGIQFDLLAADADVLRNLVFDLARVEKREEAAGRVARIYGDNGLVKDPRTGVTVPHNKQFWKGGLEDFLDAWMAGAGSIKR